MDTCENDSNITSSDTCQDYCEQFGFAGESSEYSNVGMSPNCTCSNDEGTALACAGNPDIASAATAPSASSDEGTIGNEIKETFTSGSIAMFLSSSPFRVFYLFASVPLFMSFSAIMFC